MVEYVHQSAGTPSPLGLYSQLSVGDGHKIIAIAGQVGMNEDGRTAGPDCESQARRAFMNVGHVLCSVDLSWPDILKFNTYIVGRANIASFMRARKLLFEEIYPDGVYPPNTLIVVDGLVQEDLLIEIEALAVRPSNRQEP